MQGQDILVNDFNTGAFSMFIVDGMEDKDVAALKAKIEDVDHVERVRWYDSVADIRVPRSMLPDKLYDVFNSDSGTMMAIFFDEGTSADGAMDVIAEIRSLAGKQCFLSGMSAVATDKDFKTVSAVSIGIIFLIILILFKSISLPVILVSVIEFAIFINMGIPYYMGTKLPFVASIVIGTIQLGSTVDYAILMTTRYKRERNHGAEKYDAITTAHRVSTQSIMVSALSFFAATIGVGVYSNIDMISSLCILMARGALISMVVVIFVLPSVFMVFDKVIVKTSKGFLPK